MSATTGAPPRRSERFFRNVIWNWAGVALNLCSGFFLAPYIIRKLGNEGYGVWTLVFSMVEYYYLLDMGLRSASVKYSAHYRAVGDLVQINRVINTGLTYFSGVAVLMMFGSVAISHSVGSLFKISPAYTEVFSYLVIVVGVSWGMGALFSVFDGVLEGFQRFDLSSRIFMIVTLLRVCGSFLILKLGYGILALGITAVSSQLFGYCLTFFSVRMAFPQVRFGVSFVNLKTLREMFSYGVHTLVASVSDRLLGQNPNLLIGHFRSAAEVGYFSTSVRLLQYVAEAVYRAGSVTASNAAELCARGEEEAVARFGIYANRYCLTLFLPLGIFLWVLGPQFIGLWLNPEFGRQSARILPALVIAYEFAIAGQFNSSAILFGLAKHRTYSRSLLGEAILSAGALYTVIPRYGIAGASLVVAILMIANRGLFTPWLICHYLHFNYLRYMASIYLRPLLAAVPALLVALFLKHSWLPNKSLIQVLLAALLIGIVHYAIGFAICLEKDHRTLLLSSVVTRLNALFGRRAGEELHP